LKYAAKVGNLRKILHSLLAVSKIAYKINTAVLAQQVFPLRVPTELP